MSDINLFRSKPTLIEAVLWDYSDEALGALIRMSGTTEYPNPKINHVSSEHLLIKAGVGGAQGWVPVPIGHWVVRNPGDPSDLWPVEGSYFASKYEAADDRPEGGNESGDR